MNRTFSGQPLLSQQAQADIATLRQQLMPLAPIALQALRLGMQERKLSCLKLWFQYMHLLALYDQVQEEAQGSGNFMKLSDDFFVEI
jgi:hypothetical protein